MTTTRDPEALKQAIKDTCWAVLLTGSVAAVFGLLLLAHPQKTDRLPVLADDVACTDRQ